MKTIFTLFIFIFICIFLKAQNLIAVEHNGASTFYATLEAAINVAQNGDNVYVPGGSYNIQTLTLSKGINLIGCGYNPDSSKATGVSQLNGDIVIIQGSDNGSITGFGISGTVSFGNDAANQSVLNYSISRCSFDNLNIIYDAQYSSTSIIEVRESIIRGSIVGNGGAIQSLHILESIVQGLISTILGNALFENDIFLFDYTGSGVHLIYYTKNSIFRNNIFVNDNDPFTDTYSWASTDNQFYSNVFRTATGAPGNLNDVFVDNLFSVSDIFIKQSGTLFQYTDDYHLTITSPGNNHGTDGTDVGIYGTVNPWKEGGVPYNPHIQFRSIGTTTNQGNLNVNIKVAAQNN